MIHGGIDPSFQFGKIINKLILDRKVLEENLKLLASKNVNRFANFFPLNCFSEGDTSSMGTVSRTEEVSRLNDVEDSFEERYLKVRVQFIRL